MNIFISYRKDDSKWNTQILYDRLRNYFPAKNIFKDFNTIRPGDDYTTSIEKALNKCQVLLVVMGKGWLNAADAEGNRRLDNFGDLVRIEIATALRRKIRVIPVLFDNIKMPGQDLLPQDLHELSLRQAINVSEQNFDYDIRHLAEEITNKKLTESSRPFWHTLLRFRFVLPAIFLACVAWLVNSTSGVVTLKTSFFLIALFTPIFISLIVSGVLQQRLKAASRNRLQMLAVLSLVLALLSATGYIYFYQGHTFTYEGFGGKKNVYVKGDAYTSLGETLKKDHPKMTDEDLLKKFLGGPDGRKRLWEASGQASNRFVMIILFQVVIIFAALGCALLLEMLYYKNARSLEGPG